MIVVVTILLLSWFGSVSCEYPQICCGYDSIRRRIVCFVIIMFAPLVLRILQYLELIRCQQGLDPIDSRLSVSLKTDPDVMQKFARCPNLCGILRGARPSARLLSGINTGLVGCLVLLARVGKDILECLQFGSLRVGELHLLLDTGWENRAFAQRPVVLQSGLVFRGFGERNRICVDEERKRIGVGVLRE